MFQLGFDQTRGLEKEKRLTHKVNIYICGTGLQGGPGSGCYLGQDPEGEHDFVPLTCLVLLPSTKHL